VIQYDSDDGGTIDAIAFISGRISGSEFSVQSASGTAPTETTSDDQDWDIFRAYTSLFNWEVQDENDSIDDTYEDFDADLDLVTDNTKMLVACYTNGTTADTTAVDIDGWTTGVDNYIKIYTPTDETEVGTSQRHNGKEGSGYKLNTAKNSSSSLLIRDDFVRIDGIMIDEESATGGVDAININNVGTGATFYLSNIVVHGSPRDGIQLGDADGTYYVWNTISYNNNSAGFRPEYGTAYVYNSTAIDNDERGFYPAGVATTTLKNNISKGNTIADFGGTPDNIDYCASADGSADSWGGTGNIADQTFSFIDKVTDDFHLASGDTSAIDAGTDLSGDSNFAFSDDIDGHLRTEWDIGADEASIEFDPTVMESGGDYSSLALWEAAMQTDLTVNTTRVFSHGGITGTIADTDSVTGLTSGATADVVHATSSEILLENISGTFQSGEQIFVAYNYDYVTSSNAGNPAIAAAKIDGTWTSAETRDGPGIEINGWKVAPESTNLPAVVPVVVPEE